MMTFRVAAMSPSLSNSLLPLISTRLFARGGRRRGWALTVVDDTDQKPPRAGDRPDERADRLEGNPVHAATLAVARDDGDRSDQTAGRDRIADRHPLPRGAWQAPLD